MLCSIYSMIGSFSHYVYFMNKNGFLVILHAEISCIITDVLYVVTIIGDKTNR